MDESFAFWRCLPSSALGFWAPVSHGIWSLWWFSWSFRSLAIGFVRFQWISWHFVSSESRTTPGKLLNPSIWRIGSCGRQSNGVSPGRWNSSKLFITASIPSKYHHRTHSQLESGAKNRSPSTGNLANLSILKHHFSRPELIESPKKIRFVEN